jgi:hypothetical protein
MKRRRDQSAQPPGLVKKEKKAGEQINYEAVDVDYVQRDLILG